MEVGSERVSLPLATLENATLPVDDVGHSTGSVAKISSSVLTVKNAGVVVIPGEEPVDERVLTRDDPLGTLVDQAFGAAGQVAK